MSQAKAIFSTGSLYVCDTAYCFELAANAGFDGIELMCDHRYSTRDPHYIRQLMARYDQPVRVVHTPFSDHLPGWQARDQVQVIERTLALAEELGAHAIVVHVPIAVPVRRVRVAGQSVYLPALPNEFDVVKRWIIHDLPRVQAGTPVKIAIENLPHKKLYGWRINPAHWNTVAEWSQVHDWLTLDTTHWAVNGTDALDAYRAANGRVCNVHLSNFDGREHRLPHRGDVDLGRFLRALAHDGYSGTISLELHPDALDYQDADALRRHLSDSRAFIRQHAGV